MADKKNTTAKKETVAKTNTAAAAAVTAATEATKKEEAVKKTAAPKKVSAPVKKEEPKKASAEKAAPVKKAEEPKKRGRKAGVKKPEQRVQEVYFEFGDKQVEAAQLVSQVEQAYKSEGHQIGRIKDLKIYVNSEEGKAYYVINGVAEDKFIEL